MAESTTSSDAPDWNRLYETAADQEGLFTTAQAAGAGYSPQALAKHLKNGRIVRVRRGIYRLIHFPAGEHEDLVAVWLWSGRAGILSHETALFLHGLSDVLPARAHLTLPLEWSRRRLRVPEGVGLHFATIGPQERSWAGPVPVTDVPRTLTDCVEAGVAPDFIRDAYQQAVGRGLVRADSLPGVVAYLSRYGGIRTADAQGRTGHKPGGTT